MQWRYECNDEHNPTCEENQRVFDNSFARLRRSRPFGLRATQVEKRRDQQRNVDPRLPGPHHVRMHGSRMNTGSHCARITNSESAKPRSPTNESNRRDPNAPRISPGVSSPDAFHSRHARNPPMNAMTRVAKTKM